MKNIRVIPGILLSALLLAALACTPAHAQSAVSYNDVILLINDASTASVDVGTYFATRRNIPAWHQFHFRADSSESMDSLRFVSLRWNLQAWMKQNNLVDSVNYIVTTKGCPLRVTVQQAENGSAGILSGLASFEDCLSLINGADSVAISSVKRNAFFGSRYFGSGQRFQRSPALPIYLVTRLDAYTVDQIKSYIRRAEDPAVLGEGLWVLDIDPGRDNPNYRAGNDWMRGAYSALQSRNMNVFMDTTNTYVHGKTGVIGYYSWGSNDGNSGGGQAAIPGNTWLNGSIAETIVSTGGRSFTIGTGYGQSLVADILAEGVCAVKGYTDEPYLTSIAHADILFDRYASGWYMAESYYAASQLAAWRQVVVGDPKMRLITLLEPSVSLADCGIGFRYQILRDTVYIRNTYSAPVTIDSATFTGTNAGSFSVPSGTFPATIPARDSLRLPVVCMPHTYGPEQVTLALYHRKAGDPKSAFITITATGSGQRPDLLTPRLTDFGVVQVNKTVQKNVTLTNNTPTDTIVVTGLTVAGASAARFIASPAALAQLPKAILPGASWDVGVAYTPTSTAPPDTATLNVASNATTLSKRLAMRGNGSTSGLHDNTVVSSAGETALTQIGPNPFAGPLHIRYRVAASGARVRLEILDVTGRSVHIVYNGPQTAGDHDAQFLPFNLPNGMYFCSIISTAGDGTTVTSRYPLVYFK